MRNGAIEIHEKRETAVISPSLLDSNAYSRCRLKSRCRRSLPHWIGATAAGETNPTFHRMGGFQDV